MRPLLILVVLCSIAHADRRTAPAVRIEADGDRWSVVASVGSNDAIARTMTCVFVDAKDRVISDDCRLIRIDKTETTCQTAARLPERFRVRFSTEP